MPAYREAHAGYLLLQKLARLIPGVQSSTVTVVGKRDKARNAAFKLLRGGSVNANATAAAKRAVPN